MIEINSLEDLNVDWLIENNYDYYFFGLGFIQVKLDEQNRCNFYHPDLPAFVENPHDHRYNFVSKVLRGRLVTEVWEENTICKKADWPSDIEIDYVSCQKDGGELETPEKYKSIAEKVGTFVVNEGSSYYISKDTFHRVAPDFSVGPCVTLVTRGPVTKVFAKILNLAEEVCPFSKNVDSEYMWKIVEECIKK